MNVMAPQGRPVSLHEQGGGLASASTWGTLRPGAHPRSSHFEIVSLMVRLLRTALRKLGGQRCLPGSGREIWKSQESSVILCTSDPARVFLIPKSVPRLLFDIFVSVLKMRVLYLNSLSANIVFYNLLGGWDVGANKTRSRTQKEEIRDKQVASNRTGPGEGVSSLPRKKENCVLIWTRQGSVPAALLAKYMVLGGHSGSLSFGFLICRMRIIMTSLLGRCMDLNK